MAQRIESKVFGDVRVTKALTVLAASGCVAALAACSSDDATYRPAPRYTSSPQQPQYTQPAPNAYNPPPAAPPKPASKGCGGNGKCG